jgi:hypothetical protein
VKAAVYREFGRPQVIEDATSTRRNTVTSESGWRPAICQSDVLSMEGAWGGRTARRLYQPAERRQTLKKTLSVGTTAV